jgi:PiT family inorganic phosphate transporter
MDLKNIEKIEKATEFGRKDSMRLGLALFFLIGVMLFVSFTSGAHMDMTLIIAAMIGGYMAMNIGANDVANNVGPAVGSKAMTMMGAIVIAAVFEAGGAIIAGGDVVGTIKSGIIDPALIGDTDTFVWLMMAALLAGALWLNLATYLGAPVSTTHSIVGGVLGAGIAAAGWGIANWGTMGSIVASWVISPVMGGVIAAVFLYMIKRSVTHKPDMIAAAKKVVPILIGLMAWAFITYLALKGVKQLIKVDFLTAATVGLAFGAGVYLLMKSYVSRTTDGLENHKETINDLFTIPLIFAAALLSFAHGANDVANAIGPLAAITDALSHGGVASKAAIPLWVMLVGAMGIALGLALYGPKLIQTVGSEITELDKIRAFCIAMAAALTVIVASQLGLPVSSTHIAVGAVFGVGFLREYLKGKYEASKHAVLLAHMREENEKIDAFITRFKKSSRKVQEEMLSEVKKRSVSVSFEETIESIELTPEESKAMKKLFKKTLVKRSQFKKIIAAWLITVPATATLAAVIYFAIRGYMLP